MRFGAAAPRAWSCALSDDGAHELAVGFEPGEPKRMRGRRRARRAAADVDARPLVSVFLPDRLELVKGAPALRRAHLDQFVAALWPARAAPAGDTRRRSRSATRCWRGSAPASPRATRCATWDRRLAATALALMRDRGRRVGAIANPFGRLAEELGLGGDAEIRYRPRSRATTPEELTRSSPSASTATLSAGSAATGRIATTSPPCTDGRELRAYGSQGQQRLALLALLLAEREAIASEPRRDPADAARRRDERARP